MNKSMKRYALVALLLLMLGIAAWQFLPRARPLPPPSTQISAVSGAALPAERLAQLTDKAPLQLSRTLWSQAVPELIEVAPVVVEDWVYLAAGKSSHSGRVMALDLQSGQVVWEVFLGNITDHAPVVAGDLLYVGTRGGTLLALERATGTERWSFQGRYGIAGSPVVEEGVLYLGSEALTALDAATGSLRWRRELSDRVVQPLAYADGMIAAIGSDHQLYLLDAGEGMVRLTFPLWFNPTGGPMTEGATVAVSGDRGAVQALDLQGRDIFMEKTLRFWWTRLWLYGAAPRPPLPPGYLWQYRDAEGVTGRLLGAGDGHFYLGLEDAGQRGRVLALAAETGEVMWEVAFPALIAPAATLLEGLLVMATAEGKVVGVEVGTGELLWELALPGPVLAAPAFSDQLMLAPVGDGVLYALELESIQEKVR
jgi:eukaryotic-like serine/threonine-protein kinase